MLHALHSKVFVVCLLNVCEAVCVTDVMTHARSQWKKAKTIGRKGHPQLQKGNEGGCKAMMTKGVDALADGKRAPKRGAARSGGGEDWEQPHGNRPRADCLSPSRPQPPAECTEKQVLSVQPHCCARRGPLVVTVTARWQRWGEEEGRRSEGECCRKKRREGGAERTGV